MHLYVQETIKYLFILSYLIDALLQSCWSPLVVRTWPLCPLKMLSRKNCPSSATVCWSETRRSSSLCSSHSRWDKATSWKYRPKRSMRIDTDQPIELTIFSLPSPSWLILLMCWEKTWLLVNKPGAPPLLHWSYISCSNMLCIVSSLTEARAKWPAFSQA